MNRPNGRHRISCLLPILAGLGTVAVAGLGSQVLRIYPPAAVTLTDPVAMLGRRIERGEARLDFTEPRGYLDALLSELDIPAASQMLVFSKTSLQSTLISPDAPRAIYFNDDVYIGWVKEGPLIEIASTDPEYGTIFYTLGQDPDGMPDFQREGARCINCHLPTRWAVPVPRLMVMSVMPNEEGVPVGLTVELSTDRSPIGTRWGGWYVTGTVDDAMHRGNAVLGGGRGPEWEPTAGRNLARASDRFDTAHYLRDRSDAAALMALTHQSGVHNLIGEIGFTVRNMEDGDSGTAILDASDLGDDMLSGIVEPLVRAMLFVDAAPLDGSFRRDSDFVRHFALDGPRDAEGRSLRDLDLETRLLRYPLSYLVYTESFERLPRPVLDYVFGRFVEVLSGEDASEDFRHLSAADRKAILEILSDTSPRFREFLHRP